MQRRTFLQAAGAANTTLAAYSQARPKNLLFLMADDHAGYVLGAAGNRLSQTPNLDALAKGGTRFAAHFCNSPVCSASRQSILTGRLPHHCGVTLLRTPLAEGTPTLATQLKAAGYRTAVFGKMHFNMPGRADLHGFDVARTEDVISREWLTDVGEARPPEGVRVKPAWKPFRDPARVWLNAEALPFPRRDAEMRSSWAVRQALQHLEQNASDPFALWISLQEPHSPFDFPLEDAGSVQPGKFRPLPVGPEDTGQVPLIFRSLSEEDKSGIIAAYYTSVRFLDRNVGRILHELDQLGLSESTLVVYLADHGYCLGHHGRFEKHCFYEQALHVPFVMRMPGVVKSGQVVTDATESVDVAPTVLQLLGLPPFEVAHGKSLVAGLRGEKRRRPGRAIFGEYGENEEACLRTPSWKFAVCSGKRARQDGYETDRPTGPRSVKLYDLREDPAEMRNVAGMYPKLVDGFVDDLLSRYRNTHPERASEPGGLGKLEVLDWYLRPRDASIKMAQGLD